MKLSHIHIKTFYFFLLLLSFFAVNQVVYGMAEDRNEIRHYDKKTVRKYQNNSDFKYYEPPKEETSSWWEKLKFWLWKKFIKLLSYSGSSPLVGFLIFATLLAGLIYLLLKYRFHLPWFSNRKIDGENLLEGDINAVHENKTENKIAGLITEKKYRDATRFMFILVLKRLNDKNLIEWTRDKTNYQYQNELNNADIANTFKKMAYFFEYVWYGEFSPTERQFELFQSEYQKLKGGLDEKN